LSGNETEIDNWILSRLAFCVIQSNEGMEKYNFRQVTSSVYNFWLYEFCDIYLEKVKPVMQSGKFLNV
jgi:valyl-tRNA synthetase